MSSKHSSSSLIDIASDIVYEKQIMNSSFRLALPVHDDSAKTNLRMELEPPITGCEGRKPDNAKMHMIM